MDQVTSAPEPWRNPAAALTALANAIGPDPEQLHGFESRDAWSYTATIDRARFPERAALDALLQQLVTSYGACLTLELSVANLEVFALEDPYEPSQLNALYAKIAQARTLDLYLKVDKKGLLQRWGFDDPSCAFVLFLFAEALERELGVALTVLEAEDGLLSAFATHRNLVILVPAHNIDLHGALLAVLGADAAGRWRERIPAAPALEPSPTDVNDRARDLLKWVHYELRVLTPLHLQLDWTTPPDRNDPIAGILCAQWTTASILYLAAQSRREEDGTWVATFAADKYVAQADIGDVAAVRDALNAAGDGWAMARALGERAGWVYEDAKHVTDRFTVFQYVVAEALQENDSAINCRELIRQAGEISRRVASAWEAFIALRLGKYFEKVRQLEELVDSTSRGYDEQIQALTKSLTDNMLAAVAVVVGSFIAAMFKSPFQPYVFWFGAGVYLAYLIVFPILVGLTVTRLRFAASAAAFAKRKTDFARRLTDQEVAEIVGRTVEKRERAFHLWFGATVFLYVVVLGVLIVALIRVPDRIRTWNDQFTLAHIDYGKPSAGTVPMFVHGNGFDKDKAVVAIIDGSVYANSEKKLTVYGSNLLTLTVPQDALPTAKTKEKRSITIKQGTATVTKALPPRN
jgi:hypothetical protein